MAIALGNAIRLKFNLARCERTAFDRNAPDENKEFDVDRIFFFLAFLFIAVATPDNVNFRFSLRSVDSTKYTHT